MNTTQPTYEEVTVPAGANQQKKTLADVQDLAQWVYKHGEHESCYLFASIYTELEEGSATFAVYEPTQNPDAESSSLSWNVTVHMEGDWQTFLYYMVLDSLKQHYGYEDESAEQCEASTECAVPKH